jgi:SAM-dependent methyltransferase
MLIDWQDRSAKEARCPVCFHAGSIPQTFSFQAESLRDLAGGDRVAMLRCPACDVRFCDPLVSVDYADADERGGKFYLESGAGIDVMLEALALADDRPVSRYLEIGCSFGFMLDYARRMLGWEVRGFDPGALARLGRDLLDLPIDNSFFQAGQGFDGWADLVFCSEVIEHIPDPASFLTLLSSALQPDGQLILTTPNGDALAEEADPAVLSAILSPGHHIILYNPASITALLQRQGFAEVRVEENGFQLRVAASRTPMQGRSSWFDRDRYRTYLQTLLAETGTDSPLGTGIAYRLAKEQVNGGDYSAAQETYAALRASYRQLYGFDLADPASIPAPAESLTFDALGKRWPFNLPGLLYFQGLVDWLGSQRPAEAAISFEAAARIGRAMRQILRTAGVDDLEMADLGRQASLSRLSAMAQYDPNGAAEALRGFTDSLPDDEGSAAREALALGARRRLFLDLVNLAQPGAAEAVLGQGGLEPREAALVFALGWHLMTHRRDYAGAEALFAQAWADEQAPAKLRRRALECRLAALAEGDPDSALRRGFRDEVNSGRYGEARESFALLRDSWLRRYAFDLADPALIPQPAESVGVEDLLRRWPLSLCAVLYFQGLIHWLEAGQPAKAAAHFHASARFAGLARHSLRRHQADDAELADLGRKAGLARLSALAQYDPAGAAEALLTFIETLPEEDDAKERAALAVQARRGVFVDLVNLGHLKAAELVLESGELGLSQPLCEADLPAAYALAIYRMNRRSDFPAAAALFGAVADAARATSAGHAFLWTALFHQGMAIRLGGLGETGAIAAELRDPADGLPPVPAALLERLGELLPAKDR